MNSAFLILLTAAGTLATPASRRLAHRLGRPLLAPALRQGLLVLLTAAAIVAALTELSMSVLGTLVGAACAVVVWSLGAQGPSAGRPLLAPGRTVAAAVVLLVSTAVLLVTAQVDLDTDGSHLLGWWEGLLPPRASLAAVLACPGLVLLLGAPANAVVSAVLAWAGRRDRSAAADGVPPQGRIGSGLRGGRVIGPMERWLVLALAGAGIHAAIAALVAAKGVIRFPEIAQDAREGSGAKAEEFLIGSLTSWALASSAALVLARL